MAKEKFEKRKLDGAINVACKFEDKPTRYWVDDKREVVDEIIRIVRKYAAAGYTLTLRQLHYQFVGHRQQYVNHDSAYKKLGDILDDCRYSGLIDWDAIEDRGRVPHLDYWVEDIANALDDTAESYKLDRMRGQDNVIEVWTEKDALSGIFKRSTQKYHVRLCVNKGYTSSSAIYKSYQRVKNIIISGKAFVILYFGDHDPSGLDMIRDIRDRIEYFLSNGSLQDNEYFYDKVQNWWDENEYDIYNLVGSGFLTEKQCDEIMKSEGDIKDELMKAWESARIRLYINQNNLFAVNPIGLTIEQIKQYDLPPNPTKLTDSRAKGYIAKFGQTCWEVDALEPQVLTDIVESNIESLINVDLYESVLQEESEERTEVEKIAEQYRNDN